MKLFLFVILFPLLLIGCSSPNTMEEVFHHKMENNKEIESYELVEMVEEDQVIIFTAYTEEDDNKDQPMLAYFTKPNDKWTWTRTSSCSSEWSGNVGSEPYLWCGTVTEPKYEKVIVGDTEAKLIAMNDGTKRVWYQLSQNKNEEIKAILTDGSEEWLKEVVH
ncbi:hypothetical protein BN1058_00154 [Paraliobacillus sp. PM-2]|uniref:hypothetical protein n=1 Tax=Paraliobacillus sp. PM-2 TaxID=1462524 RepID=UPI00061C4BF2|nr:hypothetical protein [Paraliobacillus sp. PM-2]CQR45912.1 hypothetical protein BN1058_00154 [Paraliobacillus sp. PM-2]